MKTLTKLTITMKTAILALVLLASVVTANAQGYSYEISAPDYFGNQDITGPGNFRGTISGPDYFGEQQLHYNNGTRGTISGPDYFGNRTIQVMPRRNSYNVGGY